MKLILLDSSGLTASVAVTEDNNLIAEYNVQYKKTHSQTLLPMLDELKSMVELDLKTVDAVAIAKGPGSFTGLRIGSATAKGLCQALNIPIVEIDTLEGLACNAYGFSGIVCPMMDARRQQVYTGAYVFNRKEGGFEMETLLPACALSIEEISQKLNELSKNSQKDVLLLGDGIPVYEGSLRELITVPFSVAPLHMNRQRASAFAFLAVDRFAKGQAVDFKDHAPEYLRLSQAERERKEGIRNKGSNY